MIANLTVQQVLEAHAQFGSLDYEMVKKAMGPNWPKHWEGVATVIAPRSEAGAASGLPRTCTLAVYIAALDLARANNQTVGEKGDYYITLEQLERLIRS